MRQTTGQQRKAHCCSNQVSSIHTRSLKMIGVGDCEIRLRRKLRSDFSLIQPDWGKRDCYEDKRYSSSAGLFQVFERLATEALHCFMLPSWWHFDWASGVTNAHGESDRIGNDRNHDASSDHAHSNKDSRRPVRARTDRPPPQAGHASPQLNKGVPLPKRWHQHLQPQEQRLLQRMTICSWRRSSY